MNFSDFLKARKLVKKISSTREHYEELGGQKTLGVALRQFQLVESGKYPPSESVLLALFAVTLASERHTLIKAYFRSTLGDEKNGPALLEYLENYLQPGIESSTKSVWESGRRIMIYRDEQLEFLINHPDASKLHKRVILYEKWPENRAGIPLSRLKAMESLDLVRLEEGNIFPSRTLYRLPRYEDSGSGSVSRAHDYIRKQIDVYGSREGASNQELGYAFQLVTPAVANRALKQVQAFKRWVQSTAATETSDDLVPLVFVVFAKALERKDL